MTTHKFRLTEDAVPLVEKGEYRFQVGFERPDPSGGRHLVNWRKCPIITMNEGDVVSTTNDWAAQVIEAMVVPNRTLRNGKARAADNTKIFVAVDDATPHQHDLDTTFSAYKA